MTESALTTDLVRIRHEIERHENKHNTTATVKHAWVQLNMDLYESREQAEHAWNNHQAMVNRNSERLNAELNQMARETDAVLKRIDVAPSVRSRIGLLVVASSAEYMWFVRDSGMAHTESNLKRAAKLHREAAQHLKSHYDIFQELSTTLLGVAQDNAGMSPSPNDVREGTDVALRVLVEQSVNASAIAHGQVFDALEEWRNLTNDPSQKPALVPRGDVWVGGVSDRTPSEKGVEETAIERALVKEHAPAPADKSCGAQACAADTRIRRPRQPVASGAVDDLIPLNRASPFIDGDDSTLDLVTFGLFTLVGALFSALARFFASSVFGNRVRARANQAAVREMDMVTQELSANLLRSQQLMFNARPVALVRNLLSSVRAPTPVDSVDASVRKHLDTLQTHARESQQSAARGADIVGIVPPSTRVTNAQTQAVLNRFLLDVQKDRATTQAELSLNTGDHLIPDADDMLSAFDSARGEFFPTTVANPEAFKRRLKEPFERAFYVGACLATTAVVVEQGLQLANWNRHHAVNAIVSTVAANQALRTQTDVMSWFIESEAIAAQLERLQHYPEQVLMTIGEMPANVLAGTPSEQEAWIERQMAARYTLTAGTRAQRPAANDATGLQSSLDATVTSIREILSELSRRPLTEWTDDSEEMRVIRSIGTAVGADGNIGTTIYGRLIPDALRDTSFSVLLDITNRRQQWQQLLQEERIRSPLNGLDFQSNLVEITRFMADTATVYATSVGQSIITANEARVDLIQHTLVHLVHQSGVVPRLNDALADQMQNWFEDDDASASAPNELLVEALLRAMRSNPKLERKVIAMLAADYEERRQKETLRIPWASSRVPSTPLAPATVDRLLVASNRLSSAVATTQATPETDMSLASVFPDATERSLIVRRAAETMAAHMHQQRAATAPTVMRFLSRRFRDIAPAFKRINTAVLTAGMYFPLQALESSLRSARLQDSVARNAMSALSRLANTTFDNPSIASVIGDSVGPPLTTFQLAHAAMTAQGEQTQLLTVMNVLAMGTVLATVLKITETSASVAIGTLRPIGRLIKPSNGTDRVVLQTEVVRARQEFAVVLIQFAMTEKALRWLLDMTAPGTDGRRARDAVLSDDFDLNEDASLKALSRQLLSAYAVSALSVPSAPLNAALKVEARRLSRSTSPGRLRTKLEASLDELRVEHSQRYTRLLSAQNQLALGGIHPSEWDSWFVKINTMSSLFSRIVVNSIRWPRLALNASLVAYGAQHTVNAAMYVSSRMWSATDGALPNSSSIPSDLPLRGNVVLWNAQSPLVMLALSQAALPWMLYEGLLRLPNLPTGIVRTVVKVVPLLNSLVVGVNNMGATAVTVSAAASLAATVNLIGTPLIVPVVGQLFGLRQAMLVTVILVMLRVLNITGL